jgi:hypothetical protein
MTRAVVLVPALNARRAGRVPDPGRSRGMTAPAAELPMETARAGRRDRAPRRSWPRCSGTPQARHRARRGDGEVLIAEAQAPGSNGGT